MAFLKFWPREIFKKYVLCWLTTGPTKKRGDIKLYWLRQILTGGKP